MFFFSESELLYPEGTISPSGGIAADILCKGRDYLVSSGIFVAQPLEIAYSHEQGRGGGIY